MRHRHKWAGSSPRIRWATPWQCLWLCHSQTGSAGRVITAGAGLSAVAFVLFGTLAHDVLEC